MQVHPPLVSCASVGAVALHWTLYQKVPFCSSHFPRLVCSSVTDSGAWGYSDVTFHPVETIEEFRCHTVEMVFMDISQSSKQEYKLDSHFSFIEEA